MNIRSVISKLIPYTVSAALMITSAPFTGTADEYQSYLKGDINTDGDVNTVDLSIMGLYLSGKTSISRQGFINADMDGDGTVDSIDLILFRKNIVQQKQQQSSPTPDVTSTAYDAITTTPIASGAASYTTTAVPNSYQNPYCDWLAHSVTSTAVVFKPTAATFTSSVSKNGPIKAPLADMQGSMPSQGLASLCVFYVDFPDCPYTWEPSLGRITEISFLGANDSSENYPHESISAFYSRSSKHQLRITGQAFRYTTIHEKEYYEQDTHKQAFVKEVLSAMDADFDYNYFDADGDKVIDAVIMSVPEAAGDDNWWTFTSSYKDDFTDTFDGTSPGHIVIGNEEIKGDFDYEDFVSCYIHELGHCMGLPDYYLYNNSDSEGLHGSAGYDTMDEIFADYSCASKLMLGWYDKNQVQVYDGSEEQTFILRNAQSEEGNCVIIPYGELDENYRSEFLVVEYTTLDQNNSAIPDKYWWRSFGSGVRVFHVDATAEDTPSGMNFRYRSGNNEATDYNRCRRFIRIVNDSKYDNLFNTGDAINRKCRGFNFYDIFGLECVDPRVEINVGEKVDDAYIITISRKVI